MQRTNGRMDLSSGEHWREMARDQQAVRYLSLKPRSANVQEQ
ncbi:hypothetical protein A2U01_0109976, partial [Trifolium medium]|nr:hypothetical protein [Trifolium medium]